MKLFRCKKGEKEVNNQRSNKLSKQPTGRKYSIYFWAAVSFCLIFYGTSSTSIEHFDENSLKNILNSIGQAIISGLVITFIINIPDMFSYFQKVLYKTITSDEYLEQLTLEEVEDLKNSCTKLISKSIPDIAEGLLELEYKIVEYYRSPYYENYSTFVSCSRDGNYLVKDITTEYTLKNPMAGKEKIEAIAQKIYGASKIEYLENTEEKIEKIEKMGYGNLPICIAKTQYSFSDDPKNLECIHPFNIHIKDVVLKAGAEFIVIITGKIMTMPGLPRIPAAENIDIDKNGNIIGIF